MAPTLFSSASRRIGALAVVLLGIAAAAGTAPASTPDLGFGVPILVDPISNGGEPRLAIDSSNRMYIASVGEAMGGAGPYFAVSTDEGQTFQPVTKTPGLSPSPYHSGQTANTGDTDVAVDRRGKAYYSVTFYEACGSNYTTTDAGRTMSAQPVGGCTTQPTADRQYFQVYDPPPGMRTTSAYKGSRPLIYQSYTTGVSLGRVWTKSTDGLNFTPAVAGNPPAGAVTMPRGDFTGFAIDQLTGKVFAAVAVNGGLYLNVGTPDAQGNLTWLDGPNNEVEPLIKIVPTARPQVIKALAFDEARNLYLAYSEKNARGELHIYITYASASSHWRYWAKPLKLTPPGVRQDLWPAVVGGRAGHLGVAYYTTQTADPEVDSGQTWYLHYSALEIPTDAAGRALEQGRIGIDDVRAVDHPVHYNSLCVSGLNCSLPHGANRSFADFLDVAADSSGAAVIAYNDDSDIPANAAGVSPYAPLYVVKQSDGVTLTGQHLAQPSRERLVDRRGDANYPVLSGSNVPGLDLTALTISRVGKTLRITMSVADLRDPVGTSLAAGQPALLRFIARWRSGPQDYFAGMDLAPASGTTRGYLGVPTYPIQYGQSEERNYSVATTYPDMDVTQDPVPVTLSCPPSRWAACTITWAVPISLVGNPAVGSVLDEISGYSFVAGGLQGPLDSAQQYNTIPLTIDGICCGRTRA